MERGQTACAATVCRRRTDRRWRRLSLWRRFPCRFLFGAGVRRGFRDDWDMTGCAGGNLQGTPKPSKIRLCLQTKVSARLLFGNVSIEVLKTPAAVPPGIPKNTWKTAFLQTDPSATIFFMPRGTLCPERDLGRKAIETAAKVMFSATTSTLSRKGPWPKGY